ncbi:hypothetical protein NL676_006376 [Syzygium grande]|nr:hypothetical protein NL676_006376 [Syzygium grande]
MCTCREGKSRGTSESSVLQSRESPCFLTRKTFLYVKEISELRSRDLLNGSNGGGPERFIPAVAVAHRKGPSFLAACVESEMQWRCTHPTTVSKSESNWRGNDGLGFVSSGRFEPVKFACSRPPSALLSIGLLDWSRRRHPMATFIPVDH